MHKYTKGEGDGGTTFCVRLCPALSSGAWHPPALPPTHASSSPSRRLPYLCVVAVAVGQGGDARGGMTTRVVGPACAGENDQGDDGPGG